MTPAAPEVLEPSRSTGAPAEVGTTRLFGGELIASARTTGEGLGVGGSVVVGRDPAANVQIPSPNVSRMHALIERGETTWHVTDLGSTNGTWLNGEQLAPKARTKVRDDDDLRLGPHPIELAQLADDGSLSMRLAGLHVDVRSLTAPGLERVGFVATPGELVLVLSGTSENTAALHALLAGAARPSSGQVLLDGLSLGRHGSLFRRAVGATPRDPFADSHLSARELLLEHGRLTLGRELSPRELTAYVDETLRRFDLVPVANDPVGKTLALTQRRQLAILCELLHEPSLLLLDGLLDGLPGPAATELAHRARRLADEGRTVFVSAVRPPLAAWTAADKILVLTARGRVAWFGPPGETADWFGFKKSTREPATAVLAALGEDDAPLFPAGAWSGRWRDSEPRSVHVTARRWARSPRSARARIRWLPRARTPGVMRELRAALVERATTLVRDRRALFVQWLAVPLMAALALFLVRSAEEGWLTLSSAAAIDLAVIGAALFLGMHDAARRLARGAASALPVRPTVSFAAPLLLAGAVVPAQLLTVALIAAAGSPSGAQELPNLLAVAFLGWSTSVLGSVLWGATDA